MVFWKILGLVYTVAQVLVPCLPPVPLSSEELSTDKYLGKWYYVGVASWDDEDIEAYKRLDNSIAEVKKGVNNTLVMSAALHEDDKCLNMAWTYDIDPDLDPVMTEGSEHLGVFLDGNWIKCPSCMLIAKLHTDTGFLRVMLFARSKEIPADLLDNFKYKLGCFNVIDRYVIAPRTKEFCKLEGTE